MKGNYRVPNLDKSRDHRGFNEDEAYHCRARIIKDEKTTHSKKVTSKNADKEKQKQTTFTENIDF